MRLYKGQDGGGELKERQKKKTDNRICTVIFPYCRRGKRIMPVLMVNSENVHVVTPMEYKRAMKRAYERYDTIYSVDFCTKEEWEEKIVAETR